MDGWMDGWMDGRMDEWMDKQMDKGHTVDSTLRNCLSPAHVIWLIVLKLLCISQKKLDFQNLSLAMYLNEL